MQDEQHAEISGVRPLHMIADQVSRFGHSFDYGPAATARSEMIWNSKLAKDILSFFAAQITHENGSLLVLLFLCADIAQQPNPCCLPFGVMSMNSFRALSTVPFTCAS